MKHRNLTDTQQAHTQLKLLQKSPQNFSNLIQHFFNKKSLVPSLKSTLEQCVDDTVPLSLSPKTTDHCLLGDVPQKCQCNLWETFWPSNWNKLLWKWLEKNPKRTKSDGKTHEKTTNPGETTLVCRKYRCIHNESIIYIS